MVRDLKLNTPQLKLQCQYMNSKQFLHGFLNAESINNSMSGFKKGFFDMKLCYTLAFYMGHRVSLSRHSGFLLVPTTSSICKDPWAIRISPEPTPSLHNIIYARVDFSKRFKSAASVLRDGGTIPAAKKELKVLQVLLTCLRAGLATFSFPSWIYIYTYDRFGKFR